MENKKQIKSMYEFMTELKNLFKKLDVIKVLKADKTIAMHCLTNNEYDVYLFLQYSDINNKARIAISNNNSKSLEEEFIRFLFKTKLSDAENKTVEELLKYLEENCKELLEYLRKNYSNEEIHEIIEEEKQRINY